MQQITNGPQIANDWNEHNVTSFVYQPNVKMPMSYEKSAIILLHVEKE